MANYDFSIDGNLECGEAMCGRRLCRAMRGTSFVRRHKVLRRGDRLDFTSGACRKVWIIIRGMTAICAGLSDGRRQILGFETAGDVVCAMSTGQSSGGWIEAMSETVLCELELRSDQTAPLSGPADHGRQNLIAELFNIVHQRLELCSAHLVTLGRLDSTERVILFLVDMASRIGRPLAEGVFVEMPMTREDIADYLGLNTETISRIFTRLKKSKLVQFPARNTFSVTNMTALTGRLPVTVRQTSSSGQIRDFLNRTGRTVAVNDGVPA